MNSFNEYVHFDEQKGDGEQRDIQHLLLTHFQGSVGGHPVRFCKEPPWAASRDMVALRLVVQ